MTTRKEVWQRGPIKNIPALLQPVAHALLEVGEEVNEIMTGFPEALLWERPAGAAAPAFHLQHMAGVIDRLFTYARNESLTREQLFFLSIEGDQEKTSSPMSKLIENLNQRIDLAVIELAGVNATELSEARGLGRARIPTTLIGLYFHAAEHAMRHTGQLLVTVRVIKAARQ